MKSIITIMVAVIVMLALAACGSVTETGNPIYVNDTFGVEVEYPSTWGVTELAAPDDLTEPMAAGAMVCFEGGGGGTNACLIMSRVDPEPASLIAYLTETYPTRDFTAYGTTTLSGFVYEYPDEGPGGGDVREYYFLNGDVLVRVLAEVFPAGEAELVSLLNGISFQ